MWLLLVCLLWQPLRIRELCGSAGAFFESAFSIEGIYVKFLAIASRVLYPNFFFLSYYCKICKAHQIVSKSNKSGQKSLSWSPFGFGKKQRGLGQLQRPPAKNGARALQEGGEGGQAQAQTPGCVHGRKSRWPWTSDPGPQNSDIGWQNPPDTTQTKEKCWKEMQLVFKPFLNLTIFNRTSVKCF